MRHQRMKFALLLTLGSTVLVAGPFQNGGFESPVISVGPDFTATSTSTTLRFSDFSGLETFGDHFTTNWALDAVSVTQTSGAPGVPEPSTFTLMSLALAAFGWRWRKGLKLTTRRLERKQ